MHETQPSPAQYYQHQLEQHTLLLGQHKKRHQFFTMARLVAFLLIVATLYWFKWNYLLLGILVIEMILFVYLINKWLDVKMAVEREKLYIELNEHELKALSGDWSNFEAGETFLSKQHPYAADMDLFGEKSVFQYINRTVLPLGTQRLAQTLSSQAQDIELNREMITEMSENIGWTHQFIVESKAFFKDHTHLNDLATIKKQFSADSFGKKIISWLRWLLPCITISSIVLYNLGTLSGAGLTWVAILVLLTVATQLSTINRWAKQIATSSEKINVMQQQIKLFEQLKLRSKRGREFQEKLIGKMGVLDGLTSLNRIGKRTEFRNNVVVGLALNYLFAWDFHLLVQSKTWYKKYAQNIDTWEAHLAEVEVWISGAIYRYNQEKTCFATSFGHDFKIEGLTHPFVTKDQRICNDFVLQENESFLIITGPNMAGKSTYLRSVGLAILSANAGFPILATSYSLPTLQLYSSMRTNDDLSQNSSYFHAELMRLKFIANAITEKKHVFVILDEILKGTNSHDKAIGSAQFLSKLQKMGAKGIIATHDLSLTDLAKQTSKFKNMYFDSTIEEQELLFDYKIREGVCQNMNASFLLKKMNLV